MDAKKVSDAIQTQVSGYLSDFQGQSQPYRQVLSGKRKDSPVLQQVMGKIESGEATIHDLGRGYKHTPHAPPGVLFKYIAHRVNNVDKYHSPIDAHKLDHEFMASVRAGGAVEQNQYVTPRHLNTWLNLNPQLVEQALANKDSIVQQLADSGLNIRKINSDPYVAMTRGLDTPHMGPEMPLVSVSDKHDSGFGNFQHHVWMPIKDLWYAYPYSPQETWGDHGHENEWLFSNSGQRYAASIKDISPSHFANQYDTFETPLGVVEVKREPPQEATPDELKAKISPDLVQIYKIVTHPSFNDSVASSVVEFALAQKNPAPYLSIVAMAKEPSLALHKVLIDALDKGPEAAPFLPAKMVGQCFKSTRGAASSRSFNNAKNTERYLRGLADYFGRFEDAESPFNAYHMVVCGGRMDDTIVNSLADIQKAGKTLPGLTGDQTGTVLSEMARWNQHLTQRHLQILSSIPACALGLLNRNAPLAPSVQEGIAKHGEADVLLLLAAREDLAPETADQLLKRFQHVGNPTLGVSAIASNPRIPIELLKKHLNESTPRPVAAALQHGIQERSVERANIVKPAPVGGME